MLTVVFRFFRALSEVISLNMVSEIYMAAGVAVVYAHGETSPDKLRSRDHHDEKSHRLAHKLAHKTIC